jgi:hypothetical protein
MTEISPESTTPLPYRNAAPAERPASDIKSFEPPYTESGSDEALNLRDYWRVFVKRKWTILTSFIITVVITADFHSHITLVNYTYIFPILTGFSPAFAVVSNPCYKY